MLAAPMQQPSSRFFSKVTLSLQDAKELSSLCTRLLSSDREVVLQTLDEVHVWVEDFPAEVALSTRRPLVERLCGLIHKPFYQRKVALLLRRIIAKLWKSVEIATKECYQYPAQQSLYESSMATYPPRRRSRPEHFYEGSWSTPCLLAATLISKLMPLLQARDSAAPVILVLKDVVEIALKTSSTVGGLEKDSLPYLAQTLLESVRKVLVGATIDIQWRICISELVCLTLEAANRVCLARNVLLIVPEKLVLQMLIDVMGYLAFNVQADNNCLVLILRLLEELGHPSVQEIHYTGQVVKAVKACENPPQSDPRREDEIINDMFLAFRYSTRGCRTLTKLVFEANRKRNPKWHDWFLMLLALKDAGVCQDLFAEVKESKPYSDPEIRREGCEFYFAVLSLISENDSNQVFESYDLEEKVVNGIFSLCDQLPGFVLERVRPLSTLLLWGSFHHGLVKKLWPEAFDQVTACLLFLSKERKSQVSAIEAIKSFVQDEMYARMLKTFEAIPKIMKIISKPGQKNSLAHTREVVYNANLLKIITNIASTGSGCTELIRQTAHKLPELLKNWMDWEASSLFLWEVLSLLENLSAYNERARTILRKEEMLLRLNRMLKFQSAGFTPEVEEAVIAVRTHAIATINNLCMTVKGASLVKKTCYMTVRNAAVINAGTENRELHEFYSRVLDAFKSINKSARGQGG